MDKEHKYIDFEAYERVTEPHKREKVSAWRTATGLQDVDGLRVSEYLKETAIKHIEGDITITRTTAVFIIMYLQSCGFKVNIQLFADNSRYFRNAIVRANYQNSQKGIQPDKPFLVKFFPNLLFGENNELMNRYMLIGYKG